MSDDTRDIAERLQDFDHYGNTATERFQMRLEAYVEIKKLRDRVSWLETQRRTPQSCHAIEGSDK